MSPFSEKTSPNLPLLFIECFVFHQIGRFVFINLLFYILPSLIKWRMALPFFINQNRCAVHSLTAEKLRTFGHKCFKLTPKQPASPESWFLGLHVFVLGTYMKVSQTHVQGHLPVNIWQTCEQVLFLELRGFVTVAREVGHWLGGLTLSLYRHFFILRSLLSILGHAEGLLLILSSGQELTRHGKSHGTLQKPWLTRKGLAGNPPFPWGW